MKYFGIISAMLLLVNACSKTTEPGPETGDLNLKAAERQLVKNNNTFSFDIFNEISKNDPPDKNVFISPLSMYFALAMAANGADGETRDEFTTLLGWNNLSKQEILESLKTLNNYLISNAEGMQIDLANSVWPRIDFSPNQEFIDITTEYLNAEVHPLDFALPEAVDIINAWIADNTEGKITDALDEIPADAIMYLINAIYFNASWKYEFADSSNTEGAFYPNDAEFNSVTFMNQEANFAYTEQENFRAVNLPYSDTNYYMTVLLPDNDYSVEQLIGDLDTAMWQSMKTDMRYREISLQLPKFKFEYGTRLINKELQALGLQIAFSQSADFGKITPHPIFISRVLHKAFVDVNEKGTEAAAVTIIEFRENTVSNTSFTVNKPFVFAICEEKTDAVLFMGKVMNPNCD